MIIQKSLKILIFKVFLVNSECFIWKMVLSIEFLIL